MIRLLSNNQAAMMMTLSATDETVGRVGTIYSPGDLSKVTSVLGVTSKSLSTLTKRYTQTVAVI